MSLALRRDRCRLEGEHQWMTEQTQRMQSRLAESFCGKKPKQTSPALQSFTWGRTKIHVDLLLDNADLAIYHLKGFLDAATVEALNTSGPAGEARQKDIFPVSTFLWDAPLYNIGKRAEAFAEEYLRAQVLSATSHPREPLRIFSYLGKDIHV